MFGTGKKRLRIPALAIPALLTLAGSVLADIAPDPLTGGLSLAPYGSETTRVRMVSENVLVRVFQDEIVAVAEFQMFNEGDADSMEVGFPYAYEGNFTDFHAFVNGREVMVRDGKQENVGRKKVTVLWKTWDMVFEKNEGVAVRVEYKTKPYEHGRALIWTDQYISMPEEEIAAAQELTREGQVSYTLDTGAGWNGILDSCRVEIELVDKDSGNIKTYYPKDGVLSGNRVVWNYRDYEPSSRVVVVYYPDIHVEDVQPFMLGLVEKYPDDPYLASSVASKYDDDDTGLKVYHSFLARWDKPVPQLMEYASGGRCRYSFKGAGGEFYTVWRMASILYRKYDKQGTLLMYADIAPKVRGICSAIIDSLDTCDNLPKNSADLYDKAKQLRDNMDAIMDEKK